MPRIKQIKNKNQLRVITEVDKPCFYCEKPIEGGRTDKKFCDNICRMNYNNALKAASNNFVRNVNNTLIKNRRILYTILSSGNTKVTRNALLKAGFQFDYHTHTRTNKNGGTYFYSYDYGYLALESNQYLIVRHKE